MKFRIKWLKSRINLNFFLLSLIIHDYGLLGPGNKGIENQPGENFVSLNFILSYNIYFRLVLIYYSTFVKRLFHFY